ncbi:glycosyltransferase family 2 protein [Aeromonas sp. QDB63]|uniref:glycosyltransferase family 2 protein n=1 Tax=Aeromonas sp. QDB63 TaxID=2989825 RepID=UPI0022E275BB|nr:glycosyltransferase family 2 protein [Aeromonas sp. QDB63]
MNANLVSIITPTYNAISYIESTYFSITNQTYKNWEWIVTDDLSTDGTYEYLLNLESKDSRVKVFRNLNNFGPAVSRNNSIEKANGRYIAFLDSDDLWAPEKLKTQINFMLVNKVPLSYSDYSFIDENDVLIERVRRVPNTLNYKELLRENKIGCLTAIYDTHAIGKVFMPLIRKRQDYGLWLNILKLVPKAYRCPGVLAVYRIRKESVSSNKIHLLKYNFELFYKHQNISFLTSLLYVFVNAFNKFKSM